MCEKTLSLLEKVKDELQDSAEAELEALERFQALAKLTGGWDELLRVLRLLKKFSE